MLRKKKHSEKTHKYIKENYGSIVQQTKPYRSRKHVHLVTHKIEIYSFYFDIIVIGNQTAACEKNVLLTLCKLTTV